MFFDLGCCHLSLGYWSRVLRKNCRSFPKSGEEGQGCKGVLLQSSSSDTALCCIKPYLCKTWRWRMWLWGEGIVPSSLRVRWQNIDQRLDPCTGWHQPAGQILRQGFLFYNQANQRSVISAVSSNIVYAKSSTYLGLVFSDLDLKAWYLMGYSDASLMNASGERSQLGLLVLLTEVRALTSMSPCSCSILIGRTTGPEGWRDLPCILHWGALWATWAGHVLQTARPCMMHSLRLHSVHKQFAKSSFVGSISLAACRSIDQAGHEAQREVCLGSLSQCFSWGVTSQPSDVG